jgi:hypothetical protein
LEVGNEEASSVQNAEGSEVGKEGSEDGEVFHDVTESVAASGE